MKLDDFASQLDPPETPLTFRQELAFPLFQAIHGGRSCALVGFKGIGMSNLLRFICRRDVATKYLAEHAARVLFINLESDPRFEAARVYESIIRQILRSARAAEWPRADIALLSDQAKPLSTDIRGSSAEDILVEMLTYVSDRRKSRLALVLDEFDRTFAELSPATLRGLRRVRDDFKEGLSFLIGARREPGQLVEQCHPGEPDASKFVELFTHTFYVMPYEHRDAMDQIARKTFEWQAPLSVEQQDRLYRATGGHARMLTVALSRIESWQELPWADIERRLRDDVAVAQVCHEIWDDLDAGEQVALRRFVIQGRDSIDPAERERLRQRGLLIGGPASVFSTLFESYLQRMDGNALVTVS